MKLLHTSDWHLGKSLYGRSRHKEYAAFLDWLADTIKREGVDILLVAGDIFDTTTPGTRAQELYYRFLNKVSRSSCRHAVFIAGNHDSPSFLNAPRELLRSFNIHIVASAGPDLSRETLLLRDGQGVPELMICAVPYLRDRDIRTAEPGETPSEKEGKLITGTAAHYAAVASLAGEELSRHGDDIPMVVTGHLFTAGGAAQPGDGMRDLYVGALGMVPASVFPERLDYLALGHLHIAQRVNQCEYMRYSGSPLPLGFAETGRAKSVCLVEFSGRNALPRLVEVPVFQRLERITGDWEHISARAEALRVAGESVWLEIIHQGDELLPDLRDRLEETIKDSPLEILCVKNRSAVNRVLGREAESETLDQLNEQEVFERCLAANTVPEEQRPDLRHMYQELLRDLLEHDRAAEERA